MNLIGFSYQQMIVLLSLYFEMELIKEQIYIQLDGTYQPNHFDILIKYILPKYNNILSMICTRVTLTKKYIEDDYSYDYSYSIHELTFGYKNHQGLQTSNIILVLVHYILQYKLEEVYQIKTLLQTQM